MKRKRRSTQTNKFFEGRQHDGKGAVVGRLSPDKAARLNAKEKQDAKKTSCGKRWPKLMPRQTTCLRTFA